MTQTDYRKVTTDKENILNKHRTQHGSASLKEIYDAMEEYADKCVQGYIDAQKELPIKESITIQEAKDKYKAEIDSLEKQMTKSRDEDDMYSWGVEDCEQRVWKKALEILESTHLSNQPK